MSLGSPSAPPSINVEGLIAQQGEENRITSFTPLGDLRFGTVGSSGQFVPGTSGTASFIDLPPESQSLFDIAQATSAELGERGLLQAVSLPSDPLDFSGLPGFSGEIDFSGLGALPGINDFSADATRVEEATFGRLKGLLDPVFEIEDERLRQTLANQGLPIGGEAFEREFDRFNRIQDEALLNASLEAVGAGRAEQSRLFGLASSARSQGLSELLTQENLARGARQQGITEQTTSRGLQFNELAAFLGFGQVSLPQFAPPPPIDVVGPAALAAAQQQNAFNASQQSSSDFLGGLFGLGSSAILGAGKAGGFGKLFG